jgi:hypothetical protein
MVLDLPVNYSGFSSNLREWRVYLSSLNPDGDSDEGSHPVDGILIGWLRELHCKKKTTFPECYIMDRGNDSGKMDRFVGDN